MSVRREMGERVWLEGARPGVIRDKRRPWMGCLLGCGDSQCAEWANVQLDDGTWVYHVSECDMFDNETVAKRVTTRRRGA